MNSPSSLSRRAFVHFLAVNGGGMLAFGATLLTKLPSVGRGDAPGRAGGSAAGEGLETRLSDGSQEL